MRRDNLHRVQIKSSNLETQPASEIGLGLVHVVVAQARGKAECNTWPNQTWNAWVEISWRTNKIESNFKQTNKTIKMPADDARIQRPNGFRTMSILGYIAQGLSIPLNLLAVIGAISEGWILTAALSLILLLLIPVIIILIFMMAEQKSNIALNLIRIYIWASFPYIIISNIVAAAETGEVVASLVGIIFYLVCGLPIALYWQQKSHSDYLKSFNHQ